MPHTLKQYLSTVPLLYKLGAAVVIFIILASLSSGVGLWVAHIKDRQFDKRERERDELLQERTEALARAELYERAAAEAEAKRATYESLLNALGAKGEQLRERAENEEKKFDEEMRAIGNPINPVERCKRICERLRLSAADCACE